MAEKEEFKPSYGLPVALQELMQKNRYADPSRVMQELLRRVGGDAPTFSDVSMFTNTSAPTDLWSIIFDSIDEAADPYAKEFKQNPTLRQMFYNEATSPKHGSEGPDIPAAADYGFNPFEFARRKIEIDNLTPVVGAYTPEPEEEKSTDPIVPIENTTPEKPVVDEEAAASEAIKKARQDAKAELDNMFSGNWLDNLLPNSLADPYIGKLMGDANTQAKRNLFQYNTRGALTDQGLAGAFDDLGMQAEMEKSKLRTGATNLLGDYRSQLERIADEAYGSASSIGEGQTFNASDWFDKLSTKAKELGGNFAGDFYGLGKPTIDTGSSIYRGGQTQGVQNPQNPLISSMMNQRYNTSRRF